MFLGDIHEVRDVLWGRGDEVLRKNKRYQRDKVESMQGKRPRFTVHELGIGFV